MKVVVLLLAVVLGLIAVLGWIAFDRSVQERQSTDIQTLLQLQASTDRSYERFKRIESRLAEQEAQLDALSALVAKAPDVQKSLIEELHGRAEQLAGEGKDLSTEEKTVEAAKKALLERKPAIEAAKARAESHLKAACPEDKPEKLDRCGEVRGIVEKVSGAYVSAKAANSQNDLATAGENLKNGVAEARKTLAELHERLAELQQRFARECPTVASRACRDLLEQIKHVQEAIAALINTLDSAEAMDVLSKFAEAFEACGPIVAGAVSSGATGAAIASSATGKSPSDCLLALLKLLLSLGGGDGGDGNGSDGGDGPSSTAGDMASDIPTDGGGPTKVEGGKDRGVLPDNTGKVRVVRCATSSCPYAVNIVDGELVIIPSPQGENGRTKFAVDEKRLSTISKIERIDPVDTLGAFSLIYRTSSNEVAFLNFDSEGKVTTD